MYSASSLTCPYVNYGLSKFACAGEHVSVYNVPQFFNKFSPKAAAKHAYTSAGSGSNSSALDSYFRNLPATDMEHEVMLPTMASNSQPTSAPSSRMQQSAHALLGMRQEVAALRDTIPNLFATQTLQNSTQQSPPVSQRLSQLHCSAQAQLSAPAWQGMKRTSQREGSPFDAGMQAQGLAVQPFSAEAALPLAAHGWQLSHKHTPLQQAAAGLNQSALETQVQQVDTSPVDLQLLSEMGSRSAAIGPSLSTVQVTTASSNISAAFGQKLVRQPMSPGNPDQADVSMRQWRRLIRVHSSASQGNQRGREGHDVIGLTQDVEVVHAAEMGSAAQSMQHSMDSGQVGTGCSKGRKRGREQGTENEEAPLAKKVELSSLEDQELVWAQYLNWPHWPAKVNFPDCLFDSCCTCLPLLPACIACLHGRPCNHCFGGGAVHSVCLCIAC